MRTETQKRSTGYSNLIVLLALASFAVTAPAQGSPGLTFHPIADPYGCRIVDTRLWGADTGNPYPNPLVANQPRSLRVVGVQDFRPQGGNPCDQVPRNFLGDRRHGAVAIVVDIEVLEPTGEGELFTHPETGPNPNIIPAFRFAPGGNNLVKSLRIPLPPDRFDYPCPDCVDLSLSAVGAGAHVVVKLTGYYSESTSTSVMARINGIPGIGSGSKQLYGSPYGTSLAANSAAGLDYTLPPGCWVSRFYVSETNPIPAKSSSRRIYTLFFGGLSVQHPFATCTTTEGIPYCRSDPGQWLFTPIGFGFNVVAGVYLDGALPPTDARLGWELNCD